MVYLSNLFLKAVSFLCSAYARILFLSNPQIKLYNTLDRVTILYLLQCEKQADKLLHLFAGFQLERFYENWKEGENFHALCFHIIVVNSCSTCELAAHFSDTICPQDCLQGKKGEIRPPKLKTEDPNKSYVQRPVKRS